MMSPECVDLEVIDEPIRIPGGSFIEPFTTLEHVAHYQALSRVGESGLRCVVAEHPRGGSCTEMRGGDSQCVVHGPHPRHLVGKVLAEQVPYLRVGDHTAFETE